MSIRYYNCDSFVFSRDNITFPFLAESGEASDSNDESFSNVADVLER